MIIAIPVEAALRERRVALTPAATGALVKAGHQVRVERDAGKSSGFVDQQYIDAGATIVDDRTRLLGEAQIIAQVRSAGADALGSMRDLQSLKAGQIVVGFCEPLTSHDITKAFNERNITLMSMELIPRTTKAQAMDALSSQANLAGYKAVLLAANLLGQVFPMLITAAGTIQPAKVFVVGAGVAGLSAIATAKRLGAVVSAIDVRPEVKQQVESLGARFVMPPVEASGQGGYAKELTPEQKAEQQKMMADTVASSDVVITTAQIPGRPSPKLVTTEMVGRMKPGSVIVDMAAERGGNCELTKANETIDHNGVTIAGPTDLSSQAARDASTMYAGNLVKLFQHLCGKTSEIQWKMEDEIINGMLVCRDGQIVNTMVRKAMES